MGFISPLIESSVRKRAEGKCEYKGPSYFEMGIYKEVQDACGSEDLPRVVAFGNHDFKLLCRKHYQNFMEIKAKKGKIKVKPKSEDQTGLFD
jgi:hypothetical protein